MTAAARPAGAWTELAGGVRVRQSRVFAMNSVVLSDGHHTLLTDPGVLPSELDDLARATAGEVSIFFSHGDWDHVLGRPWWPDARTIGHDALAGEVRRERDAILAAATRAAADAGEDWTRGFAPFRPDLEMSGLHAFKVGPWHLVARDARGHSATMLSLHVPALALLVAGDMLSDIEIPLLTESAQRYRRALTDLRLLAAHGAITCLVPGHGSIAHDAATALARIDDDLAYLDQLTRQAAAARAAGLDRETAVARGGPAFHPAASRAGMDEAHRRNVGIAWDEAGGGRRPGATARRG